MAGTFQKIPFSASTAYKGVLVAAVASPGTAIHVPLLGMTDEVWLWAQNEDTTSRPLTVEWGGTGAGNQPFKSFKLPSLSGLWPIMQGIPLLGDGSRSVAAFSLTADGGLTNVISLFGFVHRITQ